MNKRSQFAKKTLAVAAAAFATSGYAAQLEEIIVTSTKRMETIQDVPISVDVMTGDELGVAKIDNAVDLAQNNPSLNFQQGFGPAASSFAIRGLGTFALEGGIQPSVSFVLDGVGIARVAEFQAELGDIERIEVLRGPQGTLFGRNATAGAINMVRKSPIHEFEAYVEGSFTDDEELITRWMINDSLSDTVAGRLSAYTKNYDGFIENKYPGAEDEGSEQSWGIMGKLSIDISDEVNLLLTAEYRKQDTNQSPSITTIQENSNPLFAAWGDWRLSNLGNGDPVAGQAVLDDPFTINQSTTTTADTENAALTADLTWELNDSQTFKSITGLRSFDIYNKIDIDATSANAESLMNAILAGGAAATTTFTTPSGPLTLPVAPYQPETMALIGIPNTNFNPNGEDNLPISYETYNFSQEFRIEGSTDNIDYILGLYYSNYVDRARNETATALPGELTPFGGGYSSYYVSNPVIDAEATWESMAAFADATWSVTDELKVFAGLRWTSEDLELDYQRDDWFFPFAPGIVTANGDSISVDTDLLALANAGAVAAAGAPAGTIIFGANATDFKREDRSEDWSGRLGLSYDFTYDINGYASISRGFIGSGVNYGRRASYDNSVLEPSINESMEIGLKANWLDGSLRTNISIFSAEITDLQTSRLVPGEIYTETFNAGVLKSQGIEADITWGATDWLTVDLTIAYLDNEMDDLLQPCFVTQTYNQGCQLDGNGDLTAGPAPAAQQDVTGNTAVASPELSYRLSTRADLPFNDLPFTGYAVLSYTWQDDVQYKLNNDPLTVQESYGLVDITVGIDDNDGRYNVAIFGKNVGDEEFFSNLDSTEQGIGRQYARVTRNAQAYYGIKARYNFF